MEIMISYSDIFLRSTAIFSSFVRTHPRQTAAQNFIPSNSLSINFQANNPRNANTIIPIYGFLPLHKILIARQTRTVPPVLPSVSVILSKGIKRRRRKERIVWRAVTTGLREKKKRLQGKEDELSVGRERERVANVYRTLVSWRVSMVHRLLHGAPQINVCVCKHNQKG